jgi:hypothetical protein
MAEAKMHNGKAIVAYNAQGQAIDSEGAIIKGAPKPPKDTDPSQQIGRAGALSSEEKIGLAIAQAIVNPAALVAKAAAADAATTTADDDDEGTDSDESDELPPLADMPAHLESITDVDELRTLKRQDTRKGGKQLIQARIDALKGAE